MIKAQSNFFQFSFFLTVDSQTIFLLYYNLLDGALKK